MSTGRRSGGRSLYKKIVLAYDGSREGRAALREGALLAHRLNAEVFLLAVVMATPGMRMAEAAQPGCLAYQEDTYRSILDEAVTKLRDKGVKLEAKLVHGEPAQEIAAYAAAVGADLVVVGHRRQSLLQRWWSGPSGAYLSDYLGCSLLISRAVISEEEFKREFDAASEEAALVPS